MATVTFDVPAELLAELTDGRKAIGQFVMGVFGSRPEYTDVICEQLLAFHDDVGGSPEIKTFNINADDVVYDADTHKGKVTFLYRVRFFFGCSDVNADEPANEKADLEVDPVNSKLSIYIHDPIRRDTIDEF